MGLSKAQYWYKGMLEKPKFLYTNDEVHEYEDYITKTFGEFDRVYHELYSPDIHLDIILVPPSKEQNYYKLITMGMGAYQMSLPDQIKDEPLNRAELVMYLPPDWDIKFDNPENGWIITQLKIIARTPIEEKGWVGFGHTFEQDAEANTPVAPNTKLSSSLLLNALDYDNNLLDFKLPNNEKINFYQVFPIYKEELEYKRKYGTKQLVSLLSLKDITGIIDINRKNYCKNIYKNKSFQENEYEIELEY